MVLPLMFGSALFASAALLFSIQPMFARMVLPLLGGAPAVWITCMLFFQATLLAGYAYAHLSARLLSPRWQVALHASLVLLAFLALPPAVPAGAGPPATQNPVPWLLGCLVAALGLPLLVLSATAPLLQRWLTDTGHPGGKDPYFLYAASNLGSLIALLAYPLAIEPHLRLAEQGRLWGIGYGVMAALALACGLLLWRATPRGGAVERGPRAPRGEPLAPILIARWVALSAVPSSLMLGLTTYLTMDISPIPLLWVGPLALYLLTFVLAFASRPLASEHVMARLLPVGALLLVMTMAARAAGPLWLLVTLHVGTFFVAAIVCHRQLATSRPSPAQLTAFYLWIAAGGALGGVFNALVAPLVFRGVVEYPLALVLACLLRPPAASGGDRRPPPWLDLAIPLAIVGLVPGLAGAARALHAPDALSRILVVGLPALVCFAVRGRRVTFALCLAATLLAATLFLDAGGRVLHRERSFFGIHRVSLDPETRRRILWSGSTAHGFQSIDPALEREPLAYFHRTGPVGQIFGAIEGRDRRRPVAVVGLGTGSMACYGKPGDVVTFFEIDPAVERIARDPRYFTFLSNCGPQVAVVLGDARASLRLAPDGHYGLLVLDAFTSDAIPAHLLTREALDLYLQKLSPDGLLAFHISNRYLDLEPMLAAMAADLGIFARVRHDLAIPAAERRAGRTESTWVAMAQPGAADIPSLSTAAGWTPLQRRPGFTAWRDDSFSMLGLVRWR